MRQVTVFAGGSGIFGMNVQVSDIHKRHLPLYTDSIPGNTKGLRTLFNFIIEDFSGKNNVEENFVEKMKMKNVTENFIENRRFSKKTQDVSLKSLKNHQIPENSLKNPKK